MTEQEMFEKSFQRPKNFFMLSPEERWEIDSKLGILDWEGDDLTQEEFKRFENYFKSE